MSELSDVQLAIFTSQFLLMALVAEIGYEIRPSLMWTVFSGVALVASGICLFKVVRRNWVNPA